MLGVGVLVSGKKRKCPFDVYYMFARPRHCADWSGHDLAVMQPACTSLLQTAAAVRTVSTQWPDFFLVLVSCQSWHKTRVSAGPGTAAKITDPHHFSHVATQVMGGFQLGRSTQRFQFLCNHLTSCPVEVPEVIKSL